MRRWVLGWGVGALVVVIAAGLLLTIIALCRRIVGQAQDIVRALDGAREHTTALFDVTSVNSKLEQISNQLRTVREGAEQP